ncbi:MAG: TetR/AcrR family transcriptional regulator [Candidatus Acidiferrales bacterium]
MRKSRQEAAETRQRIVANAARDFNRGGIERTGLSEIMAAAGLTHGGFYKHFSSKEELVTAAAERAFSKVIEKLQKVADEAPGDRLEAAVSFYLSQRHHDHPELGCPLAALGGELARQPTAVKKVVTKGENRMLDFLSSIAPGETKALRRTQAVVALASMVGGMILARGSGNAEFSKEVLNTVATSIPATADAVGKKPAR